jgi:hypothetical protein
VLHRRRIAADQLLGEADEGATGKGQGLGGRSVPPSTGILVVIGVGVGIGIEIEIGTATATATASSNSESSSAINDGEREQQCHK